MKVNAVSGLVALSVGVLAQAAPQTGAGMRQAVECVPRGGLPNFFAKCEKGGPVRIAYFGGSITSQSGWRVQSLAHFQKRYPEAQFSEINAAIGGTGSDLGVFRLEHDVLRHKPDLVFIEFAVNDSRQSRDAILGNFEGILRKIRRADPRCDICLVYTVTVSDVILPHLLEGRLFLSANTMEELADHYGVPSINMGLEIVRLLREDKLQMRAPGVEMTQIAGDELDRQAPMRLTADGKIAFAADGVHPYNDTGHRFYTEAIVRSLPAIQAASGAPADAALPAPLDPGNLEKTVSMPIDEARMTGPWRRITTENIGAVLKGNAGQVFLDRVPSLWQGRPGAELRFTFKGSQVGFYDVIGPDSGFVEVSVDGKTRQIRRFSPYCRYHMSTMFTVASRLDPDVVHEVVVKVLPDMPDKENILNEGAKPDYQKNPGRYKETNWYAGAIFLVGEFVDSNETR